MDRPIIVLTQLPGESLELAYLGTDTAEAERIFEAKAADDVHDSVAIYYYPQPRIVRSPSSEAAIVSGSIAAQKAGQRDRIYAEVYVKERKRLTGEVLADIDARARSVADAAVRDDAQSEKIDLAKKFQTATADMLGAVVLPAAAPATDAPASVDAAPVAAEAPADDQPAEELVASDDPFAEPTSKSPRSPKKK